MAQHGQDFHKSAAVSRQLYLHLYEKNPSSKVVVNLCGCAPKLLHYCSSPDRNCSLLLSGYHTSQVTQSCGVCVNNKADIESKN